MNLCYIYLKSSSKDKNQNPQILNKSLRLKYDFGPVNMTSLGFGPW